METPLPSNSEKGTFSWKRTSFKFVDSCIMLLETSNRIQPTLRENNEPSTNNAEFCREMNFIFMELILWAKVQFTKEAEESMKTTEVFMKMIPEMRICILHFFDNDPSKRRCWAQEIWAHELYEVIWRLWFTIVVFWWFELAVVSMFSQL